MSIVLCQYILYSLYIQTGDLRNSLLHSILTAIIIPADIAIVWSFSSVSAELDFCHCMTLSSIRLFHSCIWKKEILVHILHLYNLCLVSKHYSYQQTFYYSFVKFLLFYYYVILLPAFVFFWSFGTPFCASNIVHYASGFHFLFFIYLQMFF